MAMVEERAYMRLRELRTRGLWDGSPPVPVEHVVEHLLNLTISWEVVTEQDGEQILACLRPETMEVVLNEVHRKRFETAQGLERFSIAHEAGHADVFAVAALSAQLGLLGEQLYRPNQRSATHGPVAVIAAPLSGLSPDMRAEIM